jgi:hypothetical protein
MEFLYGQDGEDKNNSIVSAAPKAFGVSLR